MKTDQVHLAQACPSARAGERSGTLSESQLKQLCVALGWQGGTFHQVLDEISRVRAPAGVHALADVVRCLLETGRYADEEGEATAALVDLLSRLRTRPADVPQAKEAA